MAPFLLHCVIAILVWSLASPTKSYFGPSAMGPYQHYLADLHNLFTSIGFATLDRHIRSAAQIPKEHYND